VYRVWLELSPRQTIGNGLIGWGTSATNNTNFESGFSPKSFQHP
jgi:hypothetical protein